VKEFQLRRLGRARLPPSRSESRAWGFVARQEPRPPEFFHSFPGWCDRSLQKPPVERFVSQTGIFNTKRLNDVFRVTLQTTPVPLRDRRRCAALPLLRSGEPEKRPIFRYRYYSSARVAIFFVFLIPFIWVE
jgi:hypothetical protein